MPSPQHTTTNYPTISPVTDGKALDVVAMSIPWNGWTMYAFPPSPLVPMVLQKLCTLCTVKKLTPSTIKGYRSALSTVLKSSGWSPGTDPLLSSLVRAYEIERPRQSRVVPQWNLALVLSGLKQQPFEPLASADLKFLTWKTVFLVALASSRRRSEIHAFCLEPSNKADEEALPGSLRFTQDKTQVSIRTNPAFLTKNQRLEPAPPVVIRALQPLLADPTDPDYRLCPVRALTHYIRRTKERRGSCFRLFLPIRADDSNRLSPDSISRWIRSAIKKAYETAGQSDHFKGLAGVSAHEVRALSTSWAAFNNVPTAEILKAAYWNNETTFSSFYLRDMSAQASQLEALGPIASAQSVVGL